MHSDISIGAAEYWESHPILASLFSGVDRMVIKNRARFGVLPKLGTSAALPLAASAEPAFSLLGMQTFHSSEAQSTLEALDVSVSVN